jgi:tetratricopeptide (TPR) repeat protein
MTRSNRFTWRNTMIAVVLVAMSSTATTVAADPVQDCLKPGPATQRLAACTAVIGDRMAAPEHKAFAHRLRGSSRLDAGALDQALADLTEAARLDPSDFTTRLLLGQVRVGRGEVEQAIAEFGEAIRLNPRSSAALVGRGHARLVKGDVEAAVTDFTSAIEISPANAHAWNNRGLAHRRAGRIDRAIEDYTAAISRNPIYAVAYNNRGYAHEARGDRMAAVADFRQALLLDPSLTGARSGLERLKSLGPLDEESARLVAEGRKLVETHCSRCHAAGRQGDSPNPKAPALRSLHTRHPVMALREPLTRGIAAPHDEMPRFQLADQQIDRIVAYINSLAPGR